MTGDEPERHGHSKGGQEADEGAHRHRRLARPAVVPAIETIIGLLVGLLALVVGEPLVRSIGGHVLGAIILVLCVLFVLLLTFLEHGSLHGLIPNARYAAVVAVLSAAVIISSVLTWIYTREHPETLYFVIDSTGQAAPDWNNIYEELNTVIQSQPDGVRIGVRAYGDGGLLNSPCPNTRTILRIAPKGEIAREVGPALANLHPEGHGSMTAAVLDAINHDLASDSDKIRLFVITSSLDTVCDAPLGGILESQVSAARSSGKNIDLLILSVGHPNSRSRLILRRVADKFRGCYLATSIAAIPKVVNAVSYYGSGYAVAHAPGSGRAQQPCK